MLAGDRAVAMHLTRRYKPTPESCGPTTVDKTVADRPTDATFRGLVEQLQVIVALADAKPELAERVLTSFLAAHEVRTSLTEISTAWSLQRGLIPMHGGPLTHTRAPSRTHRRLLQTLPAGSLVLEHDDVVQEVSDFLLHLCGRGGRVGSLAGQCLTAFVVASGSLARLHDIAMVMVRQGFSWSVFPLPANLRRLCNTVLSLVSLSQRVPLPIRFPAITHPSVLAYTSTVADVLRGCRVSAIASDNVYLYIHTERVIVKLGTGYNMTAWGEVVATRFLEEV